jgi:prepilin-type N-terminal cleavage/methylation domain-containing protein
VKSSPTRAFTLIELLAVITILVVLASLLLPALTRSKGKARQIQCLNNQRQFSIGLHLYTHENDDVLPREKAFAGAPSWNVAAHHTWAVVGAATNAEVWYNSVPVAAGRRALADFANAPSLRMNFYASQNGFHCPETKFAPTNDSYPMFSTVINAKLMRSGSINQRLTAIMDPSRTVMFSEAGVPGEKKISAGQSRYNGQPHAYASRFKVRHGAKGVLTMADGSATAMDGVRVVESNPLNINYGGAINPQKEIVWTVDPARNPN